jgi:hypothetical protein
MITRQVTPRGAMKVYDCVQRTDEWHAVRRGRPTASKFSKIITPGGKLSESARKYMHFLIGECFVTDVTKSFNGTVWTDRGNELEPCAREAFKDHTGLQIAEVGFVTDDSELVGFSPDALVVDPGSLDFIANVEMKNLAVENHVAIIDAGEMPQEFAPQAHGGMAISGLTTTHFWSFCGAQDPEYPDDPTKYKMAMRPFHQIIHWNDFTEKVAAAMRQFMPEYLALRARLLPLLRLPQTETI